MNRNAHTIKHTARLFTALTIGFGIEIFVIFLAANIPQLQKIIPYWYQLIISAGLYVVFTGFWKIHNIISPPFRRDYLIYGFFITAYTLTLLEYILFERELLWIILIASIIAYLLIPNVLKLYGLFIKDMQWKETKKANEERS